MLSSERGSSYWLSKKCIRVSITEGGTRTLTAPQRSLLHTPLPRTLSSPFFLKVTIILTWNTKDYLACFSHYVNGIIQYACLCVWVLWLNIMFVKFTYAVAYSCGFIAVYCSVLWLYHNFFIHSIPDGHWAVSVWTLINNAVCTFLIDVSWGTCATILLAIYLGVHPIMVLICIFLPTNEVGQLFWYIYWSFGYPLLWSFCYISFSIFLLDYLSLSVCWRSLCINDIAFWELHILKILFPLYGSPF